MHFSKISLLFLLGLLILSCDVDDPIFPTCNQDNFLSGTLVVNEGPFIAGAGSITMIEDNNEIVQNAFARNNCDSLIGSVLQSATLLGDEIAVVANLSNVIRILNTFDFQELGVIDGLQFPRYLVLGPLVNKAYVSQWGLDGLSGSIAEVDLKSFSISRVISTGSSGPEELQLHDQMLYVPHNGGYGTDSTVVVIDPISLLISKTIVTGVNPQSLAFDGDDLWVLNSGSYDFNDPTLNKPGSLVRISNDQVVFKLELATGVSNLVFDSSASTFYWLDFGGISRYDLMTDKLDLNVIPGTFYDLAQNPSTGIIFLCDAKDFNSQGEIHTYDPLTNTMGPSTTVGLIPGEVIFY